MAWTDLPTNYTDAVWDGMRKYNEITNDDGTVSFQDVTIYTGKEKSFFGAKDANAMNGAINTIMASITDLHPVGSLYISTDSTSPASLFGGTWEQIKDTFLLAAGNTYSAGATGGEAKVMLGQRDLPNPTWFSGGAIADYTSIKTTFAGISTGYGMYTQGYTQTAHENMPPYLAVYVWKRIS